MPSCKIYWWKNINGKGKKLSVWVRWLENVFLLRWVKHELVVFRKNMNYLENLAIEKICCCFEWCEIKHLLIFRLWVIIFTQERAPAAPRVSAFDFEQVNVCWVPPYQCIKDETTYCCNYRQMYKNLSENSSSVKAVIQSSCSLKNVFSL